MKVGRVQAAGVAVKAVSTSEVINDDAPPVSSAAEDRELVAKVLGGDKNAYRRLVEKYQKRAFHLANDIVRSREDAEDVVQESFVKAFLSLQDFKQEAAFYTWLYRIVYNMAIDYKRKMARRGGVTVEFDERMAREGDNKIEENLSGGVIENRVEGPQEALLRREQARQLDAALKTLSEEHRAVITLREIDGLSYEEIAEVTGLARGTVMSRLHYARKKIQSILERG